MTPRRFHWLLQARGPDLATWPDHQDALALLRIHPDARKALAEALAAEGSPAPDAPALCRMRSTVRSALAPATPVLRGIRWSALAACIAAGLYLGAAVEIEAPIVPTFEATSPAMVLAAIDP